MLNQFCESADRAIEEYERLFSRQKPMSLKRAQDIIELKAILEKAHSYHSVDDLILAVRNHLDTFKTGWWIFQTGHSRLKESMNRAIQGYNQPLVRVLLKRFDDIEQSQTNFEERRIASSKTQASLSQQLTQVHKERAKLTRALAKSEKENSELKEGVLIDSTSDNSNTNAGYTHAIPQL